MKGAKTISLIHDIGSIRTHRLTPTQEVKRLSHSDYILASNTKMTEWLKAHGMKKPMGALGLFDYRSANFNQHDRTFNPQKIKVAYAGALHCWMPAFAQFLLNLRNALSKVSFSFTITLDILS